MCLEEQIIDRMSKLYLMATTPVAILDTETGEWDLSYRWINPEAENSFHELSKILIMEREKRQPQLREEHLTGSSNYELAKQAHDQYIKMLEETGMMEVLTENEQNRNQEN